MAAQRNLYPESFTVLFGAVASGIMILMWAVTGNEPPPTLFGPAMALVGGGIISGAVTRKKENDK